MGSSPRVRRKRNWIPLAETPHPSVGRWQVEQERPLVPRDWKNAPFRLMGASWMLYVSSKPLPSGKGNKLGNAWALAALPAKATLTVNAKTVEFHVYLPASPNLYLIVQAEYTSFQLDSYDSLDKSARLRPFPQGAFSCHIDDAFLKAAALLDASRESIHWREIARYGAISEGIRGFRHAAWGV